MVPASLVAVIFIATSFLPRNAHPPKCVAQHIAVPEGALHLQHRPLIWSNPMTTIDKYHRLARETRQMAATVVAVDVKEALEKIALSYEALAQHLEGSRFKAR